MIPDIPDQLKIQVVSTSDLPKGWRDFSSYKNCQPIGDKWYDDGNFPGLKVPSAVLPDSINYVLNAMHEDFQLVTILNVTDLIPDQGIEDLLKSSIKK